MNIPASSLLARFSKRALRCPSTVRRFEKSTGTSVLATTIFPASTRSSSTVAGGPNGDGYGSVKEDLRWKVRYDQVRAQSSAVAVDEDAIEFDGFDDDVASGLPVGNLFDAYKTLSHNEDGPERLVGTTASVRRTFSPGSNAKALLTCGGDELARSASFDPVYSRAQGWVRQHAVGPAVLSPVLISGLVGALVEAALPHSVHMSSSMQQVRPLIVGVEVCAKIVVDAVGESDDSIVDSDLALMEAYRPGRTNGFPLRLRTEVVRVQDGAIISQGTHAVWMPDYMHM